MALWIIATPIGTLDDLAPRARQKLAEVAVLAAEDTRVTRRLLGALDIAAPPMQALHAHSDAAVYRALAQRAMDEDVGLVSDAGTPGVSDPGRELVEAVLALGGEVRSIPGPSALAAALAASGFPAAPSSFLGFPPRKGREGFAERVLAHPETLVLYEAPTRVAELLRVLAQVQPDREAVLCRELSKRYEEVLRAPLGELSAAIGAREEVRGECVVLIGPGTAHARQVPEDDLGSLRGIAAALAQRWGVSKRDAYQRLLAIETELSES